MNAAKEFLQVIPADIIKFIAVALSSLLIGLEQRRHHINEKFGNLFGTDRTFTLIGILGYILYLISPRDLIPFLGGGGVVALLLAIFYLEKIRTEKLFGLTSVVIALITYCLAPLVYTQPSWLVFLIVVSILILTEIKETLFEFSKRFDNDEFIILAKFLVLAGVVLPLLPDQTISPEINFSLYRFWLAIVAVSGISYFSYLLKKFVFPQSGIILTGILGGLYSSTATTFILARKSKESPGNREIMPAILLATTMMYLRLFLLALFFNKALAFQLLPSFTVFVVVSAGLALFFLKFKKTDPTEHDAVPPMEAHKNPLELKTSLLFACLFIFFAFVTGWVKTNYGAGGINLLSFVVGVTDIDPFIINLFQSKLDVANQIIVMAVWNAISSNNLLKMIYAISLGDKSIRAQLIVGFGVLIGLGLLFSFVFA